MPKLSLGKRYRRELVRLKVPIFILIFAGIGVSLLLLANAASNPLSLEPELGNVTGNATSINDATASGGKAVKFGSTTVPPVGTLCDGMVNWSSASTWTNGVPVANASVTIPATKKVKVDVDVPHLNNITVPAGTELCFPDRATTFSAKEIIVLGKLTAGTPTNRLTSNVTIRLEGGVNNTNIDNYVITGQAATAITAYNGSHNGWCSDRGVCINLGTSAGTNIMTALNGGTIEMYGRERGRMWTSLAANTVAGANTLTLMDAVDWKAGDQIIIASGDVDPNKAEKATVQSVSTDKKTVTLTANLLNRHAGTNTCYSSAGETRCVEERSEVGILNSNLKVTGPTNTKTNGGFGGHTMTLAGGAMRVEDIEMYDMGQEFVLGRYPLHFHVAGDGGANSSVKDVSLHDNPNRQLTIHGTNKVNVEGMVAYKALGHSVMLEDGTETRNVFKYNLVMNSEYESNEDRRLRLSDEFPSEFWITNPDNDMIGNSAAGGEGSGIWLDLGYLDNPSVYHGVQTAKLGVFDNNIAHSHKYQSGQNTSSHVPGSGFMFDAYNGTPANRHAASNNVAWKNDGFGLWIDGKVDFTNTMGANNGIGHNGQDTSLIGGIFLGNTANTTSADGRLLYGLIRFYHGQVDIDGTWLGNYSQTTAASADGMSGFNDGGAGVTDYANRVKNLKWFGPTGWKVFHVFCGTVASPRDCYYGPYHGGNGHYIVDLDGSILGDGVPGIITNAEPDLQHPQAKAIYTNTPSSSWGTVSRGIWTPLDRTFIRVNFPYASHGLDGQPPPQTLISDTNGARVDADGWANFIAGRRYKVQGGITTFDMAGSEPGWIDLYTDRATKPSFVGKGGYNESSRVAQPECSSLTNLGNGCSWFYGGGKLYIRLSITGTPMPFPRGGDGTGLSIYVGAGSNVYWSIR